MVKTETTEATEILVFLSFKIQTLKSERLRGKVQRWAEEITSEGAQQNRDVIFALIREGIGEESELIAQTALPRMTVRNAVAELQRRELIEFYLLPRNGKNGRRMKFYRVKVKKD